MRCPWIPVRSCPLAAAVVVLLGTSAGFAAPDQITDTGNRLTLFDQATFLAITGSGSNDFGDPVAGEVGREVDVVVAGQIDTIEQDISLEAAGATVELKVLANRNVRRFAGFP